MNVLKFGIVFILIVLSFSAGAQTNDGDKQEKAAINKQYFKSYWLDTRDIAISPLKWDTRKWIVSGTVLGTAVFLYTQDANIQSFAQRNRTETSDLVTKHFLERCGSGVYSMPLMGIYYLHGLAFKKERSKKTALLGVKAYIISGVLVNIPKYLFNRSRPYHGDSPDPTVWNGPFAGKYYKSMPSGHTTSVFAVATVIAEEYKETIYIPAIAYTIAGLTGLSRINDNRHWASDVFIGAAFGWAMGKLIHNRNNWKINVGVNSYGSTASLRLIVPVG